MIFDAVFDIVIDDIFLRLKDFLPEAEVLLKIEGCNPAGSIKLKTAISMVTGAERSGRLRPGMSIIESSSGNLGIALAQVCAAKRYPLTIVTDPNANPSSIRTMEALGAAVVIVTERDSNGGFLQKRIDFIASATATNPHIVWLNQYANQDNPLAHYRSTAPSIRRSIGRADVLVIGAGSTGTLMGCLRYFNETAPSTRIVAVDSEGSVTFGHSPAPRKIPGLGTSRRPEIFTDPDGLEKILVPERETVATCNAVARRYGILLGGSSGTILAGLHRISGSIPAGATVVAISPDLGDRYLESVYDDDWVVHSYGERFIEAPRVGVEHMAGFTSV